MKTYNCKLVIKDSKDKEKLLSTMKMQLDVYNFISKILYNNGQFITNKKIVHDSCYQLSKKEFPEIPVQYIIRSYNDVISTYKTIKSNHQKITEPAFKKHLSVRLDKRLYRFIQSDELSLTTLEKRVIVKLHIYPKLKDNLKYTLSDPLLFVRNDEIYLAMTFDTPAEPFVDNNKQLGVDMGIKRLVSTSDGMFIKSTEYIKQKRKIRYLKRQLQSKCKKSSTAKRHLKKLKNHEHNFSKNFIHNIVNEVLKTDANIIVLEDLTKLKSNVKDHGKRFNNRIGQIPFYMMKDVMTYKALALGKKLVTVNPAYTSKNDCRGLENGVRKGCRYKTSDGLIFDADIQASINIRNRHKHSDSFMIPLDGIYKPNGQGLVNNLYTVFNSVRDSKPRCFSAG